MGEVPYPLPNSPTTLLNVIPAYVYVEYNDDETVQAFFTVLNQQTQAYVDTFNQLNLPIYTSAMITGTLLDWIATWLYGYPRPGLPTAGITAIGPYNTYVYNQRLPYGGNIPGQAQTYIPTTDDVYKRCLTWNFYKGDGLAFNVPWLKCRIIRFLTGMNGTAPAIDNTYDISVAFEGPYTATISLDTSPMAITLKSGIESNALALPFQINWIVNLT
jgi:hypothetical protein